MYWILSKMDKTNKNKMNTEEGVTFTKMAQCAVPPKTFECSSGNLKEKEKKVGRFNKINNQLM